MKRLEAVLLPSEAGPFEEADFARHPSLVKGYIGPQSLGESSASGVTYLVDPRVVDGTRWITGANEPGRHVYDLVAGRDFTADGVIDVAEVRDGDECPSCGGELRLARGIEIGHIFQLGRKYAEALDLKVLDENGRLVTVTMGSYGIGVSRAVAAIAEQSHDDKGLIWPREIAPADIHLIATGKADEPFEAAEAMAAELDAAGVRVLLRRPSRRLAGREVQRLRAARRADDRRRRQAPRGGLRRGQGPADRRARGRAPSRRPSSGSGRSWAADVGVGGSSSTGAAR